MVSLGRGREAWRRGGCSEPCSGFSSTLLCAGLSNDRTTRASEAEGQGKPRAPPCPARRPSMVVLVGSSGTPRVPLLSSLGTKILQKEIGLNLCPGGLGPLGAG